MKSNFASSLFSRWLASSARFRLASCPGAAARALRLTLQDAIQKALQANLSVLVAGTRVDEAEGARAPQVGRAASARQCAGLRQRAEPQPARLRNLGSRHSISKVVGPFSNYDFRVYAQQNVVDLAAIAG
jgi:hypothetical protein